MTTSVKKVTASIISIFLLIAMAIPFIIPTAYASPDPSTPEGPGIDEEYVGVTAFFVSLSFDGGNAKCHCGVRVRLNYSATVTMQLKKDGAFVNTWNYTLSSGQAIDVTETYGAVSGSTYQVVVKVRVYDASGQLVEIIPQSSSASVCP